MKKLPLLLALAACHFNSFAAAVKSPDGHLSVDFNLKAGVPTYQISRDGQPALQASRLGLVRDDADFSTHLQLLGESKVETVRDRYEILTAKRRLNHYDGNRKVFHLQ